MVTNFCYSCFEMFQFFASDERLKTVRKMIMAVTPEQRKAALDSLLPYQRSDFEGIFRAMDGTFCFFCFEYLKIMKYQPCGPTNLVNCNDNNNSEMGSLVVLQYFGHSVYI